MIRLSLAAVLLAAAVAGCTTTTGGAVNVAGRQINVAATTGMVADLVKNIGGTRVEVTALMGPGVDPHLYKPRASDVQTLERADIIFYNGLELEGRMTDTLVKLARSGKLAVAVSEGIAESKLREPPEFEGKYDPHIWFDVALWKDAARAVIASLAKLDPGATELYQRNGEAYLKQLDDLDAYARAQIRSIPDRSRVLVTAHDAFGYFGAAYGMEVRGLQGVSTAAEASAADVRDLASFLCQRGVKAVFVESSVPRATIEAVQRAAQASGCRVAVGGELFSDALGDAGSPAGVYLGMVRHNVDTIVAGLR